MLDYRFKHFAILGRLEVESYRNRLQYAKPKKVIRIHFFWKIYLQLKALPISDFKKNRYSFEDMIMLKRHAQEHNIFEAIQLIYRWKGRKVPVWILQLIRVTGFYMAWNYIMSEIKAVAKAEKASWQPKKTDSDMSSAMRKRGKVLTSLGDVSLAMTIGEKYGRTKEEVMRWPYVSVFTEIAAYTAHGDVMKEFHELKSNKNKPRKA